MTTLARICALIEQRTGLGIQIQHRSGINAASAALTIDSDAELLAQLRRHPLEADIWQRLIRLLTISETYFLRDKHHFRILQHEILPELIQARRQADDLRLTIGSVGCSTGEELYSIATTLYTLLPDIARWQLTLTGIDINQQAIQIARTGIYREWSFRQVMPHYKQRYFTQVESGWQILDRVRDRVTFRAGNLLDAPLLSEADVLFCRHVLMYLGQDAACQVEANLFDALAPGGWLFLGQAEALQNQRDRWTMHLYPGRPVYQKSAPDNTPSRQPVQYAPVAPRSATDDVTQHYQQAVQAVHNEQFNDAKYHLTRLLDTLPDHTRGHTLLAALLASRQAYPEAEAHLNAALAADPLLADALYIRGVIALETGDYRRSVLSLQGALYCQRNHALAAFTLGTVYQKQGDHEKASRQWRNLQPLLAELDDEAFLCDVSEMRAGTLRGLLATHLENMM